MNKMNLFREAVKEAATSVEITETPEGLATIHQPGCAATIWKRTPLTRFQAWIDDVQADRLPRTRVMLQPGAVRRAMFELLEASGIPDTCERSMLVDDVSALAGIFSDLMQASYLRLRLDVIDTNACREFRNDVRTARLVCTYRGTGTQYVINANGGTADRVSTVGTGSPILLRGSLWPETPRAGLLHRAPPIEAEGETRLVLVLDPVTEPENHPSQQPAHQIN